MAHGRTTPAASCRRTIASSTAPWTAIEAVGLYVPGEPLLLRLDDVRRRAADCDGRLASSIRWSSQRPSLPDELSHWRSASDRRLRHRDDRASRQDRRAGKCLRRRRQAHGIGKVGIDMIAVLLRSSQSWPIAAAIRIGLPPIFWRKPNMTSARRRSSSPITSSGEVDRRLRANLPLCRAAESQPAPGGTTERLFSCARSRAVDRRHCARTYRDPSLPTAKGRQAHSQCRRNLSRRAHAGGDRRLRSRIQSRAADRALGALLVGARRDRFHESHIDPQMRARAIASARRCRHHAGTAEGLDAHARSIAA